jgi:hypothetical protein
MLPKVWTHGTKKALHKNVDASLRPWFPAFKPASLILQGMIYPYLFLWMVSMGFFLFHFNSLGRGICDRPKRKARYFLSDPADPFVVFHHP